MKTKVLEYSSTNQNKIVWHNRKLEKINDDIYTYVYRRCEADESLDTIAFVLQIGGVYFEAGTCSREFLQGRDMGDAGTICVTNFRQSIDEAMRNGHHVNLLYVRVFEELGWDSRPLIEYREQWLARKAEKDKRERQVRALAAEQAKRDAEERERLRLEKVKADFIAGRNIKTCDFVDLCRLAGVPIPLRTHGTLNARVGEVNISGTVYYRVLRGKRKPDLTGCHKLIQSYAETVKEAYNEVSPSDNR